MSSRLNPRDYDLGELRDAVRETPRRRRDGPGGPRRDDGRRDDSQNGHSPPRADSSSDADTSDDPRPNRTADGQYAERRSEEHSADQNRSDDGGSDRPRTEARTVGEHPSGGRTRGSGARFAGSPSRDRTADGSPRRRGRTGERDGFRRRGEARPDRSRNTGTSNRRDGADAGGFELLTHRSRGDVERPYLTRLPDGYGAQVEIFEWLERLLETCGSENAQDALAYYESVGWLSEDSREALEDFVEGLTAAEPPDPRQLDVDDHRESLRYVARLAHRVGR